MREATIFNKLFGYFFVFALMVSGFFTQSFAQKNSPVSDISTISETDTASSKKTKKSQDITDTIHYEADKIDYNSEKKILILIGKSVVQYENIVLHADTIIYNINQNFFTASGLPRLIDGKDTTVGDMMVYNIKTRRGRVQFASTHLDGGYFNGQSIMKTGKDELYVNEGDYTTCAVVDTPHFFFYGKNIKVVPKDKIISRPVVLNIGNAPVAVLPYFIFPIDRNRRSGLLTPSWGGHPTGGGYIDNIGYYYVPNDFVDFLVRGKVMDFSEFVLEGSSHYALKYKLNGSINARTAMNTDFNNSSRQWAIDYNHNQNLTPDGLTTLSGRGNLVSDTKFSSNYSEDSSELVNQNLSANLSLSHRFEKINASGNITWNRTHNIQTDNLSEELPSLNFSLPNRPLIPAKADAKEDETHWFNNIYYSYDTRGLIKHTLNKDLDRKETYYPGLNQNISLSSPQKIFKWITINPSLSAHLSSFSGYFDTLILGTDTLYDTIHDTLATPFRDTRYSDFKLIKTDTLTRNQYGVPDTIALTKVRTRTKSIRREKTDTLVNTAWWNATVDLSTKIYGIFPMRIYNFAGLRHTFTPKLTYSFVPEHKLNKMFYDIGIPYEKGHERQQILGLSLDNQFDGKILKPGKEGEKPAETKFSLLSTSLSTSYVKQAKSGKWSDLNLSASTGIKMVRLSYNSAFWFYDEHEKLSLPIMRSMNISLSTGSLGAHGSLWGGNILELDSLQKNYDSESHSNSGPQKWQFSFTPSYSFSTTRSTPTEMFIPNKQYSLNASASVNFTPNWSVNWSGDYNFTENQWVRNSININCDLECWEMRFQWRPESLNPGYYFLVNIKKIPEIKWEQRK